MPPNESVAVQLAVLAQQCQFIKQELADAKTARKSQYEKMEQQSQMLVQMDARLQQVEKSLKEQAPTIEEFITIKHKVVGAGWAGRWVWILLAGLIGVVFNFREKVFEWLIKG